MPDTQQPLIMQGNVGAVAKIFPPCSTLFVGNLNAQSTEPELLEIFK
jgi:RNA recognition motif-containing protein